VITDHDNQDIAGTKWSTRMWCFHEQHLTTKCVAFGSHWLVFDCCEAQRMARIDKSGPPDKLTNDVRSFVRFPVRVDGGVNSLTFGCDLLLGC
jgi:hypothetical protein